MAALKVLVVDDASFVRDLVKRTLRNQFPNMELQDAANGKKAQVLLERHRFDLILCDWEMPEMSGLEVLRWMRQHEAYKTIPFIMVSSRGDRDHVVEAVKEGVSEYLGKPFSADGLIKKIVKVMGGQLSVEPPGGRTGLDALQSSAEMLTRPAKPKPKPVAQEKPAPKPLAKAQAGPAAPLANQAKVRFSGSVLNCEIKAITLTELKVVARREETFPAILEQAVVDIELAEGKVARLNGYVQQLQAADPRRDTDFINVVVRWVDDDPQKMEDLTHYIARFRRNK